MTERSHPVGPARATPWPGTRFLRTPKGQVLVGFGALLAVASVAEPVPSTTVLVHLLVAVLAAALLDLPYLRVETGRWQAPTSAIITGLIVGMILAPGTPLDLVAVASAVSILGKRLIRIDRGHVFNPAVLGLLWVGAQYGSGESWWGALGNAPLAWLPLLLVVGGFVVDRLNKFPLVLMFGGVYCTLWTATSFVNAPLAAEMFRPPFLQAALFLAFFMLTDPPTSPNRYADQVWYGAIAAVSALVATLLGAGQLYLLVATVAANLWLTTRRLWQRRASLASSEPVGRRPLAAQASDQSRTAPITRRAA